MRLHARFFKDLTVCLVHGKTIQQPSLYILYVDELQKWGGHFIPHTSLDTLREEALKAAEEAMD